MKQSLTVYGCGGTGANIVQHFVKLDDNPERPLYPKVTLNVLDTSDSNLITDDSRNISNFVIPGLEGAGKDRSRAFSGAEPHVINILNDHKPSAFNIVVFSASGGSGSVIGPMIVCELLRRSIPVVAIVVASTTSKQETDNTLNTLRGFQGAASTGKTGGKPVCIIYHENIVRRKPNDYMADRDTVNLKIQENIRQLAILFSGQHSELDRSDLVNWLNWRNKHPDIPAQLTEIMIFKGDDTTAMDAYEGQVIGAASVLNAAADPEPELGQPYSCVGYVSDLTREYAEIPNHYYILTSSRLGQIFRALDDRQAMYEGVKSDLRKAELAGMPTSVIDNSGIIL